MTGGKTQAQASHFIGMVQCLEMQDPVNFRRLLGVHEPCHHMFGERRRRACWFRRRVETIFPKSPAKPELVSPARETRVLPGKIRFDPRNQQFSAPNENAGCRLWGRHPAFSRCAAKTELCVTAPFL
jgi:hypothetical protein